jgi:hypothetical protein
MSKCGNDDLFDISTNSNVPFDAIDHAFNARCITPLKSIWSLIKMPDNYRTMRKSALFRNKLCGSRNVHVRFVNSHLWAFVTENFDTVTKLHLMYANFYKYTTYRISSNESSMMFRRRPLFAVYIWYYRIDWNIFTRVTFLSTIDTNILFATGRNWTRPIISRRMMMMTVVEIKTIDGVPIKFYCRLCQSTQLFGIMIKFGAIID